MMVYQETYVQRNQHRLYVREYPGEEPAIILMHGFPDNLHLYDRLIPCLSPPRRVIAFDFLGWGASDKPPGYPYTAANQVGDLDAVITQLRLEQVILVAHDASGPPAIDWALDQSNGVAGLVLLNTYYCAMPTLRPPEAIWLFSTPVVRNIARPVSQMFDHWVFRRMYQWQVGKFFRDAQVRDQFLPLLYQQFDATPSARPAFFRLNEDLLPTIRSRTKMLLKLPEFKRPVRIIFGDADPYLNTGVARRFHELFPGSELFLVSGARHFVQMDEPGQVARLILAMPRTGRLPPTRGNRAKSTMSDNASTVGHCASGIGVAGQRTNPFDDADFRELDSGSTRMPHHVARPSACSTNDMTNPNIRLSLGRLNAIAREAIVGEREHHQVIAAVPSKEGSDYAEIVVGSAEDLRERMTIGVRRSQPEDQIRREIARRVRQQE